MFRGIHPPPPKMVTPAISYLFTYTTLMTTGEAGMAESLNVRFTRWSPGASGVKTTAIWPGAT